VTENNAVGLVSLYPPPLHKFSAISTLKKNQVFLRYIGNAYHFTTVLRSEPTLNIAFIFPVSCINDAVFDIYVTYSSMKKGKMVMVYFKIVSYSEICVKGLEKKPRETSVELPAS
jgi:hypothetical protein